jgi:hypothetical protein
MMLRTINRRGFDHDELMSDMRLTEKAEWRYKQLLGIKNSEIDRVCQPELRQAKESI